MTATRLVARRIAKPWGRRDLPPAFEPVPDGDEPVGEIWYEHPDGMQPELLVKYLFTAQPLSIQVHPGDDAAKAAGHRSGKDEAWLVVDADPDARIGIGLSAPIGTDALRAAAASGEIEQLVDWRPVRRDDSYYSPAGTVHSIGAGLALIEIQQNVDITYRLFDFGRPRGVQVEEALAAAEPGPYRRALEPYQLTPGREILADGPAFVLERWRGAGAGLLQVRAGRPIWLVGVADGGRIDGQPIHAGSAWLVDGAVDLVTEERSDVLLAYPGRGIMSFAAFAWSPSNLLDYRRRRFRDAPKRLKKAG